MSTAYTLAPINRVLRIFLLSNVRCSNHEIVPCYSKFKSIALALCLFVINTMFLIKKIESFSKANRHYQFRTSIQTIYWFGYCEYIFDAIWVYKTRHSFLEYIHLYKPIDRILQSPDNLAIRAKLLRIFVGFTVAFILMSTFDFYIWYISYGLLSPILYSISYVYTFINYMPAVDAISHIIQIEYRLRPIVSAVERYQKIWNMEDNMSNFMHGEELVNVWIRPVALRNTSFDKAVKIHSLSKLYLLLTDQVTYINQNFGARLVPCILGQLLSLIHLTNVIIRDLINIDVTVYPSYHLPALANFFWLVLSGSMQFTTAYRCEQTYKQCKRITDIIDHIFIKNRAINPELKSALSELRELIRTRPIVFCTGFFKLNYPLLLSVFATVASYTVILFQSSQ